MSKKNDYIDDLFKDAFHDMETPPNGGVWGNISNDIHGENVDNLFKDALSNNVAEPSGSVWTGVEQQLPLNLGLKRSLNRLSIVAGAVVVGMLIIVLFPSENKLETPPVEKIQEYNIDIAIEEVNSTKEAALVPDEDQGLATDNSIKEKIKSVELHAEKELDLKVDEEKMRKLLEPLSPLPIDSAIARANGHDDEITETNEGVIIPADLDKIIPMPEEIKLP
ncbi:MAG: hypothetical protein ACI94Y_000551 [Maribacter sp.]|jgi:hypothetical protein